MIDWVLSAAGLAVLVGIVLTGPWPRGVNQPAMSNGKRAVMFLSAAGALYLLLACVSDFTARRMIVYGEAMQVASQAKVFGDEVGEPFTVAWPIVLRAGVTDAGNDAAFKAKVKGPRGKGVLVVVGSKGRAGWTLSRVDLVDVTGQIREPAWGGGGAITLDRDSSHVLCWGNGNGQERETAGSLLRSE